MNNMHVVQTYHEKHTHTHTHTQRKVHRKRERLRERSREREREADKANLEKPNTRSGTEGAKVELKRRMMQQPNLMFPTQI
jgi:hypothetical protein